MRKVVISLILVLIAFSIEFALGQRGVNCYSTKSIGPYSDTALPVRGGGYYCCKDSVDLELSFYVYPSVNGWCFIEGVVWGADAYVSAYSEDYIEGNHQETDTGYSGEMTRDSLGLEIAAGSERGHFINIYLTANYFE